MGYIVVNNVHFSKDKFNFSVKDMSEQLFKSPCSSFFTNSRVAGISQAEQVHLLVLELPADLNSSLQ